MNLMFLLTCIDTTDTINIKHIFIDFTVFLYQILCIPLVCNVKPGFKFTPFSCEKLGGYHLYKYQMSYDYWRSTP